MENKTEKNMETIMGAGIVMVNAGGKLVEIGLWDIELYCTCTVLYVYVYNIGDARLYSGLILGLKFRA